MCFLTPFGKFRYLRLPIGCTNAPGMVDLLKGIPGVEVYIDDVLIHADTVEEHNSRLNEVLNRFLCAGLTLNKDKSSKLVLTVFTLTMVVLLYDRKLGLFATTFIER